MINWLHIGEGRSSNGRSGEEWEGSGKWWGREEERRGFISVLAKVYCLRMYKYLIIVIIIAG